MSEPVRKKRMSKPQRLMRLLGSTFDPRAWAHVFKLVNYYNYSHVVPLRVMKIGPGAAISPNVYFSNPERITAGRNLRLGAHCKIWAGPGTGRIVLGNDVLLGPEVMITAANYRYNDGHPVNDQSMDEGDVVIGNDVWLGTRVMVLPGVTIGDGAIVGAGSVITKDIPAMSVAVGVPARIVGQRQV